MVLIRLRPRNRLLPQSPRCPTLLWTIPAIRRTTLASRPGFRRSGVTTTSHHQHQIFSFLQRTTAQKTSIEEGLSTPMEGAVDVALARVRPVYIQQGRSNPPSRLALEVKELQLQKSTHCAAPFPVISTLTGTNPQLLAGDTAGGIPRRRLSGSRLMTRRRDGLRAQYRSSQHSNPRREISKPLRTPPRKRCESGA